MAWSTSSSGQFGVVEEIHRIAITIDIDGERDDEALEGGSPPSSSSLAEVYALGFRHYVLRIRRQRKSKGFFCVRNAVSTLTFLVERSKLRNALQDSELFITICCDNLDEVFLKELFTALEPIIKVDCLILDFHSFLAAEPLSSYFVSSFESSIKRVNELSTLMTSIRDVILSCMTGDVVKAKTMRLGIDGINDRGILQLLFELPIGKFIDLVVPGTVQLPNIRTRVIDFVHSRGANTFHFLSNETILETPKTAEFGPVLYPLIQKYPQSKNHIAPVLVKCFLQCGIMVAFNITAGSTFIREMIAPLLHPFTNRREFVAPSITKRFVVALDEVEALKEASEAEEAKEEEVWRRATLHRINPRVLTDVVVEENGL